MMDQRSTGAAGELGGAEAPLGRVDELLRLEVAGQDFDRGQARAEREFDPCPERPLAGRVI